MEKILTISIAAYNVGEYIENTLVSLCSEEIIGKLEIFVIDDGGNDNTIDIASTFAKIYPNSIKIIHKKNGGYGSTVNYSLSHATGKYFKLLDGDDWFDTMGLIQLVDFLDHTDVDVVITNFLCGPNKDKLRLIDYYTEEGEGTKQLAGFIPKRYFGMWPMTIKTSVLKASNLILPEKELYTDQYFCTYPLLYASTIQYINYPVYCYRTNRNGQSISKESRIKHSEVTLEHCIKLTEFCAAHKDSPNYPIILKRVGGYHSGAINTLLLKKICAKNLDIIKEHEKKVLSISEDVYCSALSAGRTGRFLQIMRMTNYYAYWLMKIIPRK